MSGAELMKIAEKARENAYAPYSGFTVGAALLCTDGRVYTGCNIENASFGATICAERCAFGKAVSEGERTFEAIAVSGGKVGESGSFCPPCGICRQVMAELLGEAVTVYLGNADSISAYKVSDILPLAFSKEKLTAHDTEINN